VCDTFLVADTNFQAACVNFAAIATFLQVVFVNTAMAEKLSMTSQTALTE